MARSQWTIDTLKEHIEAIIADRDVRVNLALSAAKEAVSKAEAADEKRFALLNEFRAQQADEARKYAPSELVNQKFDDIGGRLSRLENGASVSQGQSKGTREFWGYLAAVLSLLIAAAVFFTKS